MTGDDQPRPGSVVFQTMFSFSLQVVGMPIAVASACPCPPGPRNWGHSGSAARSDNETSDQPAKTRHIERKKASMGGAVIRREGKTGGTCTVCSQQPPGNGGLVPNFTKSPAKCKKMFDDP